jgi:DNA-directed RNA polymerase specialized sigma24 family protein
MTNSLKKTEKNQSQTKNKPTFESLIPIIQTEIDKRKRRWTLASVSFEDVSQMVMIRVFNKYHLFEPDKGDFLHWVNKVISSAMKNIMRDNYLKYSRPCIMGCVFNTGGDTCSKTPSGKQCAECPLYEKWQKTKELHHNIKQSLPIENHIIEAENFQCDFIDIENKKTIIDEKIKNKLKPLEYKVYQLLYIDGMSDGDAGRALQYKQTNQNRDPGYQQIAKIKIKIVKAAKEVIEEEDLA